MTSAQLASLLNHDRGTLCVPAVDRRPVVPYSHWRITPPGTAEYETMWSNYEQHEIHVLCGHLCAIDVDAKNDPSGTIVQRFEEELKEFCPDIFEKLYIEQTASGGRHYFFYTDQELPTKNLAFKDQQLSFDDILEGKPAYRPIIEYRGQNGLCRCFPSSGITPVQNDITNVLTLQQHEVLLLIYICELFNEKPEEKIIDEPIKERVTLETPGNDYSARVPLSEFCDMMARHGWVSKQRGQRIFLRRPNAKSRNFDADIKNRIFMNFSGSVSEFECWKGYSLWRVYAVLEHGGNFSEAAKALAGMGYGSSTEVTVRQQQSATHADAQPEEQKEPTLVDRMVSSKVMMARPPAKREYSIKWRERPPYGQEYDIAGMGMIVLVSGEQKARKTSLLTAIIAAGLCGQERAGFSFSLAPDDQVIWLDTEQGEIHAFNTARRIVIQALMREFPDNVHYYSLVDFTCKERMVLLDQIEEAHKNIRVIVMDGAVDFVEDFNDNREATRFGQRLVRLAKNRIVFPVMHVNRAFGRANGHVGAILERKCSVQIKVMLNEDGTSEVTFPDTRDEKPPAFSFSVIGPNIPVVSGYPVPAYDFSVGNPDWKPKDVDQNFPTEEPPTFNPMSVPRNRSEFDDPLSLPAESLGFTDDELNELYG